MDKICRNCNGKGQKVIHGTIMEAPLSPAKGPFPTTPRVVICPACKGTGLPG